MDDQTSRHLSAGTPEKKSQTCPIDFESFVDSLNDGLYIIDSENTIRYVNSGLVRIMGYTSPNEIIGRNLFDFIHPDAADSLEDRLLHFQKTHIPSSVVITKAIRKDGSIATLEIKPGRHSSRNWYRGVIRDITDIGKTKHELQETKSLYQSIVELSPDAIVLSSIDGFIVDFNEMALQIFKYENKRAVLGRWIGTFVPTAEREHLESVLSEAIEQREHLHIEVQLLRSDGSRFLGEVSMKKITLPDEQNPVLMILARDITEKKAYEEKLKALSVTDPLTKLYNRRGFMIAAEKELKIARSQQLDAAILFIDLNNMKEINDTYGHDTGDDVLLFVSDAMDRTFNESDVIGRVGGDEFIVFMQHADEKTVRRKIAELRDRLVHPPFPFTISLACGVSPNQKNPSVSLSTMIRRADRAMYEEKYSAST